MKVLITNDDGITSAGIRVLTEAAVDRGLDVTVAAPNTEYSGASAALSALESDGHLLFQPHQLPGLAEVRAMAVTASPAMIGIVGARGAFGAVPDLVLSGINHGPNTGNATLHSGTVGAALTAAAHGIPAMALSMNSAKPKHWPTAALIAQQAIQWMIDNGSAGWILNVNVPDIPVAELRGIRRAGLAEFGAVQATVGEPGDDYVPVTFAEIKPDEGDSDAAWLRRGWATATVLRAPREDTTIELGALTTDRGSPAPDSRG